MSATSSSIDSESVKGSLASFRPDVVAQTPKLDQELDWRDRYRAINSTLLHDKIVQATKYKDKAMLEKSLKAYKEAGHSTRHEIYEEGSKILDILNTKDALIMATKNRDENEIQIILKSIEENDKELKMKYKLQKKKWQVEHSYRNHVLHEIDEAKKVCRVIASGRRGNRQALPNSLKLERNTMSEIKRYGKPPVGLHDIMKATFLLLGTDEEITEDWSNCAQMSNPDGRHGLNRRIQAFDTSSVEPEICARAKEILQDIEYKQILRASAGGAVFYVWCKGTIDEYEATNNLDGVQPATIERQKELLRPDDPNADTHPMFVPKTNNRKGVQAVVNSKDHFQKNLRAPHSPGTDILSRPKIYTKSQT